MRRDRPENDNAFVIDTYKGPGCFHVDVVLPDLFGVFGVYTGHCYAVYFDPDNANDHAERLVCEAQKVSA